jgi:hypothetical protein
MNIFLRQYDLFNEDKQFLDYIMTHHIMVYDKIHQLDELINPVNIHYMDLEFKYLNGLRIPYYNGCKINAIQPTEDIYNYISSMSLLNDEDIITGEKIQSIADVVIGNHDSLYFNPNNIKYSKVMKNIKDLDHLHDYHVIFVFTHNLEEFYHKFEHELHDKIILSHNSDHEIKYIKNVKYHYAQNCLIKHNKLCAIPIGIENNQWFDHTIFNEIYKQRIIKTKDIYFYFNLNTHSSRHKCYHELKDKLEWNIKRNKKDYFLELSQHRYAICPRGNGLDTHRIWECLYLNVIPIVIKHDFVNIDNLPIIILNNWSEIDNIDKYEFKHQCIDKLRVNYYEHKIKNVYTNDH